MVCLYARLLTARICAKSGLLRAFVDEEFKNSITAGLKNQCVFAESQISREQARVCVFALIECNTTAILPAVPYDPGEQGNPLQAEAPATRERHPRQTSNMRPLASTSHPCSGPL